MAVSWSDMPLLQAHYRHSRSEWNAVLLLSTNHPPVACCLLPVACVQMWLMTQEGRRVVHKGNYSQPGVYLVRIRCPHVRTGGSVMVEMLDERKSYFSDEFSMSFHMHFYRIIKWILVLPLVAMLSALVLRNSPESLRRQALPSFSSSRHKS